MGVRGRPTLQKGTLWGSAFSTHVVLCILLASVVLYAVLVTSVHIIIDLMVVILDSNSTPRERVGWAEIGSQCILSVAVVQSSFWLNHVVIVPCMREVMTAKVLSEKTIYI